MKRNRVNVLTVVNSASNITTETIDGKPHIVVRGITPVVDDIVMNRKLYPAAEIEKAYNTLERNPMPLGHPKVDGKHVSARDVRAVNNYHVGAWLQNVNHKDGKVSGDMYVDRQYAESSDKGKRLINRLDEMVAGTNTEAIHISTGLLYSGIAANGESKGKKYNEIATNMMFDHVAVLLDEPGAGTPEEGVGIFVNAEGDETEIEVCNLQDAIVSDNRKDGWLNKIKFFVANDAGMSFDEIAASLREAIRSTAPDSWRYVVSIYPDYLIFEEEKKTTSGRTLFKQKYLISDGAVSLVGEPVEVVRKPTEYEIKTNGENDPMKELIINALKAAGKPTDGKSDAELMDAYNQMAAEKAAAKSETPEEKAAREKKEADEKAAKGSANNSQEAPAWFTPFAEKLNAIESGMAVNSDKEKADKRNAVKLAMNMSDEEVADLDGKALDRLYANSQKSTGLNGTFRQVNSSQSVSEMPE
ncbi:DUF2213 domain-containing protein [Cedecea colo]|uniref:DUF2213 domain-containing protein n=1 Tax=Cedecea colo TaxID=2552946 RepID=A0ABX0VJP0_9ENTR|nr:DUF2213 domain-containing protein [Cedecea colo]NIY47274.1 DUF2213 domain-containing protein [Cedecea colo]